MSELARLTWHGPPATKKTGQRVAFRGRRHPALFPSKVYEKAERAAHKEIALQWKAPSIGEYVHVEARFYLAKRQHPDLSGLIEACGDILQAAGVLVNDQRIESWDGSRRLRDRENPRTEVTIRSSVRYEKEEAA